MAEVRPFSIGPINTRQAFDFSLNNLSAAPNNSNIPLSRLIRPRKAYTKASLGIDNFSLENKTTKHSIGCHQFMIVKSEKDNK